MIRRREFITLLGGTAVAWPLTVRAQQSAMPVIGVMVAGSAAALRTAIAGFQAGLKDPFLMSLRAPAPGRADRFSSD
jgi:putative tryptophan/tyrosine transport system substrate-binding protein